MIYHFSKLSVFRWCQWRKGYPSLSGHPCSARLHGRPFSGLRRLPRRAWKIRGLRVEPDRVVLWGAPDPGPEDEARGAIEGADLPRSLQAGLSARDSSNPALQRGLFDGSTCPGLDGFEQSWRVVYSSGGGAHRRHRWYLRVFSLLDVYCSGVE